MKRLLLLIFLTAGVFLCAKANELPTNATSEKVNLKEENPFAFFNAHRQGRSTIGLMWRFKPASSLLSFRIERSYDGEFFNPVLDILNGNQARLSWKDNNVLPGYVYYRIVANLSDGTSVTSNVEIVRIVQK